MSDAAHREMRARHAHSFLLWVRCVFSDVSVSGSGRVLLWHFGWPTPLAEFSTRTANNLLHTRLSGMPPSGKSSSASEVITRIRFNALGNKLAATTESGRLLLWVFAYRPVGTSSIPSSNSLESHLLPAYDSVENAHNKGCADCVWIAGSSAGGIGGNGNLIATAGESSNHSNVCLWSVLLPAEDRLLVSFKCHEKDGGAASVAHCAASNTLVTGAAKNGVILVFSLQTMMLVRRLELGGGKSHARVHRLTYDPLADMLLAGSADGAFRTWFCSTWQSGGEWPELYAKNSFFSSSSSASHIVSAGVSDIVVSGLEVLVSGSDGSVKWMQKKRHYAVQSEFYTPAQIIASNSATKQAMSLQHAGQA